MQFASIDSRFKSGSGIYFYCFKVFLLVVLVNSVEVVSVATTNNEQQTYGTVLYNRVGKCFAADDPRIVQARSIFQDLMPYRKKRFEPLSDKVIQSLLMYFTSVGSMVDKLISEDELSVAAWYDTAGDYLHSYLYPISKYCFYSGNVSYYSVRSVRDYYMKVKHRLDTHGFGWSRPNLDVRDVQSNIRTLKTNSSNTNCSNLAFNISAEIPMPKADFDNETNELIFLWIPLKSKQSYDPRTKASLSILKEFVGNIIHCIPYEKQMSKFAVNFLRWIDDNLSKHYMDDPFYPGLESILQIKKTLEFDIATQSMTKKSIAALTEDSDLGPNGFMAQLLGTAKSKNATEYNEEQQTEDERRWLRIRTLAATALLALFFLILVVVISVKLRLNRKTMKRKAAAKREHFKTWDRKTFPRRRADQSDEEILLMLEKQTGRGNLSETNGSGWRHVKPRKSERKSHKTGIGRQAKAFTDTDDEDFDPFLLQQESYEKTPLIVKETRTRKGRCGRGCLCMSCKKAPNNGSVQKNSQDSSAYKLATGEKQKKTDQAEFVPDAKTEQPATIKPTGIRNLRGGDATYRIDTWNDG